MSEFDRQLYGTTQTFLFIWSSLFSSVLLLILHANSYLDTWLRFCWLTKTFPVGRRQEGDIISANLMRCDWFITSRITLISHNLKNCSVKYSSKPLSSKHCLAFWRIILRRNFRRNSNWIYSISAQCYISRKSSHSDCTANQMTGFLMGYNTKLK